MSQITKKPRIIDTYAQSIIISNLDLMAVISGYLNWKEIASYLLVCKCWNKSFLTRPWGSPGYLRISNDHSKIPPTIKYVNFIDFILVGDITDNILDFMIATRAKKLAILKALTFPHVLKFLRGMHLKQIYLTKEPSEPEYNPRKLQFYSDFIKDHSCSLEKLDLTNFHEHGGIGISTGDLPNLKHLRVRSDMAVYYHAPFDLLNTFAPLLLPLRNNLRSSSGR
jgi:hypothetical protein